MSEQMTSDACCIGVAYRMILDVVDCSIYAMFKNQSVICLLLPKPYLHFHNPFLIIYQCIFTMKDTPSLTVKTSCIHWPSEWTLRLFLPSPILSCHHPPSYSHGALVTSDEEGETGKA